MLKRFTVLTLATTTVVALSATAASAEGSVRGVHMTSGPRAPRVHMTDVSASGVYAARLYTPRVHMT